MKEEQVTSPARQLVQTIWDHANKDSNRCHSWTYLNQSLYSAVNLAIFAGLQFNEDDFIHFAEVKRSHYWAIKDNAHNIGEGWYSRAVAHRNMSACLAFEKWKNRKPFRWKEERICIGAQPLLIDGRWRVTSFDPEGNYFVAVKDGAKRQIKRFSHDDLKAMRKASQTNLKATSHE